MDLKRLFTDDKAVSPVVGVTMMIAIAVVLAAVVGALVLQMGQGQQSTPTASFAFNQGDFDSTSNGVDVKITHDGGDAIAHDNIKIIADGTEVTSFWSTSGNEVTAGDSGTINSEVSLSAGKTVKVVWQKGDQSTVLAKYTVQ